MKATPEQIEALDRLVELKSHLRALVEIADNMPGGEDKDRLFVKINNMLDLLETGGQALSIERLFPGLPAKGIH